MENILTKTVKKCKSAVSPIENELFLGFVIFLVALVGFGLGRLSKIEGGRTPITVESTGITSEAVSGAVGSAYLATTGESATKPNLVASKNGTKYHFLWCPGASTIKEENKVYFESKEKAEAAGYKPAVNCKGL